MSEQTIKAATTMKLDPTALKYNQALVMVPEILPKINFEHNLKLK